MSISTAMATWNGDLKTGKGAMKPDHAGEVPFSAGTRFEGMAGSNPEEMIGAALAGCFSMALSLGLEKEGMKPDTIRTNAKVHLDKVEGGFSISRIELATEVKASGGDAEKLRRIAEETKKGCPVGKVLRAEISVDAKLV